VAQKPPIKLAVFGSPVAHSLSPRIHGLFAAQSGLRVDYRAIEATVESFAERANKLAQSGGRGCNITVPLKHAAWKLAAHCSAGADRARAANTLVFSDTRNWFADSTDGPGLVTDLETLPGFGLKGARICLLGAGGAAASVLGPLLQAGPKIVTIANRTQSRALDLAHSHADLGPLETVSPAELDSVPPFDLVINATSLGHGGTAARVSANWLTARGYCYDMNYGPAAQPLRAHCARQQIPYVDGLGMLVEQAALSFKLWTGQTPDTAAVLETLRS
jgi:shikimate dehydrogenase